MVQQEGAVGGDGEDAGSGASRLAKDGGGAGSVEGRVELVDVEEGAGGIAKGIFGKGWQAVNHAMRGQDEQRRAVHVDESNHDELVGDRKSTRLNSSHLVIS